MRQGTDDDDEEEEEEEEEEDKEVMCVPEKPERMIR